MCKQVGSAENQRRKGAKREKIDKRVHPNEIVRNNLLIKILSVQELNTLFKVNLHTCLPTIPII